MARVDISEFQFSFAFFHKFMSLVENKGKSFSVPSLRQEGGTGDLGGLDLKIGNEYFFQFKMTDRLKSRRAREVVNSHILESFIPYFRFNIKNSDDSNQFNTLVELARKVGKNKVYYVSPLFNYSNNNTTDDEAFKDFWEAEPRNSLSKICFIDFHQFISSNPLLTENNDSHVICYNINSVNSNYGFLLSEPKKIIINSKIELTQGTESTSLVQRLREFGKIFKSNETIIDIKDIVLSDVLDEKQNNSVLKTLNKLQLELIAKYNILWVPEIIKSIK